MLYIHYIDINFYQKVLFDDIGLIINEDRMIL